MFHRLLIANRGEIVVRIARACRAMGVEPVFAYSDADAEAAYLREVGERGAGGTAPIGVTVRIGPAHARESYLRQEALIQAAEQTGCSALHPGYGFLSENPAFAERCALRKIQLVGPSAGIMRKMGRKAQAKEVMRSLGLPVIPGSQGTLAGLEDARRLAEEIGYPVLLKADAGGGGKGMRRCEGADTLEEAFTDATREARAAFASPSLYLEKWIEGGRHIEFQVFGDSYGNGVCLGERECSIQRSHQKLLEESPSCVVDEETRQRVGALCAGAVSRLGYEGAGTVEFLRDREGHFYFMEMNTRLQVEHPVTEMVYGVDLVREQIRVTAGYPLSEELRQARPAGHAIECRINAEDPERDFKPSPGVITRLELPQDDTHVRIDTHIHAGYEVPPFYDSLLMKVITHDEDRPAATAKMIATLQGFVIEGIKTTIPLHLRILASAEFARGELDTMIIPGFQAQGV